MLFFGDENSSELMVVLFGSLTLFNRTREKLMEKNLHA
jgi:hypothetical protein